MKKSTKNKIIKGIKDVSIFLYNVGMATAGVTAFTNPVSAIIAGSGVIASAISSIFKDRSMGKLATLINLIAQNIKNAKNDRYQS